MKNKKTFSKILLVGCGKMGGAMLQAWHNNFPNVDFAVVDPYAENLPDGVKIYKNSSEIPENFIPELVILAVKPQVMAEIAPDYARYSNACFLSIAAGKSISALKQYLGKDTAIIRSMPNLPAAIGEGAIGLVANDNVSEEQKGKLTNLLQANGECWWLDSEDLINSVTALSGSGPAYIFHMAEAMAKAGENLGLPSDVAYGLALQTIKGAALMMSDGELDATTLRQNVTSPNGTTQAALDVLMGDKKLIKLMQDAMNAAAKRAKELE